MSTIVDFDQIMEKTTELARKNPTRAIILLLPEFMEAQEELVEEQKAASPERLLFRSISLISSDGTGSTQEKLKKILEPFNKKAAQLLAATRFRWLLHNPEAIDTLGATGPIDHEAMLTLCTAASNDWNGWLYNVYLRDLSGTYQRPARAAGLLLYLRDIGARSAEIIVQHPIQEADKSGDFGYYLRNVLHDDKVSPRFPPREGMTYKEELRYLRDLFPGPEVTDESE